MPRKAHWIELREKSIRSGSEAEWGRGGVLPYLSKITDSLPDISNILQEPEDKRRAQMPHRRTDREINWESRWEAETEATQTRGQNSILEASESKYTVALIKMEINSAFQQFGGSTGKSGSDHISFIRMSHYFIQMLQITISVTKSGWDLIGCWYTTGQGNKTIKIDMKMTAINYIITDYYILMCISHMIYYISIWILALWNGMFFHNIITNPAFIQPLAQCFIGYVYMSSDADDQISA